MKPFSKIGAIVFGLVAIGHLVRVLAGWAVTIGAWSVPMWISVAGFLIPAVLAIMIWREACR